MLEQNLLMQFTLLPDDLKKEALDFIGYLLQKYQKKEAETPEKTSLRELLLKGPVASEEELKIFEDNKKWMNEWRID